MNNSLNIIEKFKRQVPVEIADARVAIEMAYAKIPDHWKICIPKFRVILTDRTPEEFRSDVFIPDHQNVVTISSYTVTSSGQFTVPADSFLRLYAKKLVQVPEVRELILRTGVGHKFLLLSSDLGKLSSVNALDCFVTSFPLFVLESILPDPMVWTFMVQIDYQVKGLKNPDPVN